jgi:hypothetical protein
MNFTAVTALCLCVGLSATVAFADTAPGDPELARLEQARGQSAKWNFVPQGKVERYGHAEVLVTAPVAYVRDLVLDFGHYRDFSAGKFKTSRIIDQNESGTDVYIQIPVLHGMLTLWEVLRFGGAREVQPGVERVEGSFVRGNVKNASVAFTLRTVGDKTVLKADVLMVPDFAAPQAMVDEELRDAAQNAVDAVQARAQQRYAQYLVAHAPEAAASSPPVATAPSR